MAGTNGKWEMENGKCKVTSLQSFSFSLFRLLFSFKKKPSRAGVWRRERGVGAGRKLLAVLLFALIHNHVMTAAIAPDAEQSAFGVGVLGQFHRVFGGFD